ETSLRSRKHRVRVGPPRTAPLSSSWTPRPSMDRADAGAFLCGEFRRRPTSLNVASQHATEQKGACCSSGSTGGQLGPHEGREVELMLAREKPAAIIERVGNDPDIARLRDAGFVL